MNTIFNLMKQRAEQLKQPQYKEPVITPPFLNENITKYYDELNSGKILSSQTIGKENHNKTFHSAYMETMFTPAKENMIKNALLRKRMRELNPEGKIEEQPEKKEEVSQNEDLELLFNQLSDKISSGIFDVIMMEEIHKILNIFQTKSYTFSKYLLEKYLNYLTDINDVLENDSTQYVITKNKKDANVAQFLQVIVEKCLYITNILLKSFDEGKSIVDRENILTTFNKSVNLKKIDKRFLVSYEKTLKNLEEEKNKMSASKKQAVNIQIELLKDLRKTMLMSDEERRVEMEKIIADEAFAGAEQLRLEAEALAKARADEEERLRLEAEAVAYEEEQKRLKEEEILKIDEENRKGMEKTLENKINRMLIKYENHAKVHTANINNLGKFTNKLDDVLKQEEAKLPEKVVSDLELYSEADVRRTVNKSLLPLFDQYLYLRNIHRNAISDILREQNALDDTKSKIKEFEEWEATPFSFSSNINREYENVIKEPYLDTIDIPKIEYVVFEKPAEEELGGVPEGKEDVGGVPEGKEEDIKTIEELETQLGQIEVALIRNTSQLPDLEKARLAVAKKNVLLGKSGDTKLIKELEKELKSLDDRIELTKNTIITLNSQKIEIQKEIEKISLAVPHVKEAMKLLDEIPKITKTDKTTKIDVEEEPAPALEKVEPVAEFVPKPKPVEEVEASSGFVAKGKYNVIFNGIEYPRRREKFIELSKADVLKLAQDMKITLPKRIFYAGISDEDLKSTFYDMYLKDKYFAKTGTSIFQ